MNILPVHTYRISGNLFQELVNCCLLSLAQIICFLIVRHFCLATWHHDHHVRAHLDEHTHKKCECTTLVFYNLWYLSFLSGLLKQLIAAAYRLPAVELIDWSIVAILCLVWFITHLCIYMQFETKQHYHITSLNLPIHVVVRFCVHFCPVQVRIASPWQ